MKVFITAPDSETAVNLSVSIFLFFSYFELNNTVYEQPIFMRAA